MCKIRVHETPKGEGVGGRKIIEPGEVCLHKYVHQALDRRCATALISALHLQSQHIAFHRLIISKLVTVTGFVYRNQL